MIVNTNYATPVMVNGFSCRNCSEVDQAKKNVDPANPAAGPFGMNSAKTDPTAKTQKSVSIDPAAVEHALGQVAAHKGSHVLRAYSGTAIAGQLLQLTV